MAASPLRVLISGAAGQIAYSLIPMVANGSVFGASQPVILHLLDITPAMAKLKGVAMEIDDGGFPLVQAVICTDKLDVAFKDVNYVILLGGFPRRQGMLRKDLLAKNSPIFVGQGQALDQFAARGVKVLVVANPANTNCLVLAQNAPSIPKSAFSALTRLDDNRASHQLRVACQNKYSGLKVTGVKNVVIWGNHSKTLVPDIQAAVYTTSDGKEHKADMDEKWVREVFTPTVQQRGAAVIEARGMSSAMSAAKAAADHVRLWHEGTPAGEYTSMAVWSDGNPYGIPDGLIFSFPVTIADGSWSFASGFNVATPLLSTALDATRQELEGEKAEAASIATA